MNERELRTALAEKQEAYNLAKKEGNQLKNYALLWTKLKNYVRN